ncbi:MAG: amidohydrolase family protein [Planctomycetota bacterium]
MMMILKAKYIICTPDIILENASITVEKGIIREISRVPFKQSQKTTYDFGESIITAGLINTHTHLEGPELYGYSNKPLKPPQQFTQWAQKIIAFRKTMTPDDYAKIITHGYNICAQNGITTVVDHTHIRYTLDTHLKSRLRRFVLEEMVAALDGMKAYGNLVKIKDTLKYAKNYLRKNNNLLQIGIAPHSTYSISPELYKMLFRLASDEDVLLSTHLSELKEEVEFLKTGKGKMMSYLGEIGRATSNWSHPGLSPVAYLKKLGILKPPSFFIHCNYLSKSDIDMLADSGSSIVFCPQSQSYFGHHNHPFRKLLKAGVNVSLGTDSLGSNSDLSILKEMNFIWNNFKGLSPDEIFKMGTVNGAKTLRLEKRIGVLKPGYAADIAVFPIKKSFSPKSLNQIIIYLIEQTPKSIFTMVNGSIIKSIKVIST